jgi:PAS domain S-box-containing protein
MESEARLRPAVDLAGQPGRPPAGWCDLRAVLDELAEGVLLADGGGRIRDANPALCRMLGVARERCVRRRFADVVRTDEPGRERIARALVACRAGRPATLEIRLRHDPSRRLHLRLMPQPIGAVIGLVHDLTDQRALEREVRLRAGYQEALDRVLATALDPVSPDAFVNRALQAIGECTQVSRSYLFAMDDARRMMVCTHEWVAPGIERFLGLEASYDDLPFWVSELRANRAIVANDIRRDLPEELHELLSTQGILSLMVVPLRKGGRPGGFLGLDECLARRDWLPLEAGLLRGLSDLLALTLRRLRPGTY